MKNFTDIDKKVKINEYLIGFINDYIKIGEKYTNILTEISTHKLFPGFKDKINAIIESKYKDFETPINI